MEQMLNVNDAAKLLKMHPVTIRRKIKENQKFWFKFSNWEWRIKESDFENWIKEISEN